MSSYKSTNFRRAQASQEPSAGDKYRAKAQQLQELFPAWSNDDLVSLLTEVNGDVELAATRISEGRANKWGPVTRKKDKKPPSTPLPASHSKERDPSLPTRERRGGRGGRGGSGLGRGEGSGGRGGRGGRGGYRLAQAQTNGHGHGLDASTNNSAWGSSTATATAVNGWADGGAGAASTDAWGAPEPESKSTNDAGWSSTPQIEDSTTPAQADLNSGWGTSTGTGTATNGWDAPPTAPNGWETKSSPVVVSRPSGTAKASKTPATSKLSWAEIARAKEKPTPSPVPAPAPAPAPPTTAPEPTPEPPAAEPVPVQEQEAAQQVDAQDGWEGPTTVQPPTWDDEPQMKVPPSDAWGSVEVPVEEVEVKEALVEEVLEPEREVTPAPAPVPVVREPTPPSALPAQLSSHKPEPAPAAVPENRTTPKISSHRSAKYKATTDQAVVIMPNTNTTSFVTPGIGIEKLGMQFGTLSFGGDDVLDGAAPEPEPVPTKVQEPPAPEHVQPSLSSSQQPSEALPAIVSPPSQSTVGTASSLFQQAIPQQVQPHTPSASHSLPSSISTSSLPTSHSTAATSPIPPFSHQQQAALSPQSLAGLHQQQHQHQLAQNQNQVQVQSHHQSPYAQHGLPTHVEQPQQSPQHISQLPQQQQQQQQQNHHSSYFRQHEPPYFHTPTPPAGQAQESPYGAFGQLGGGLHQGGGSHLGGFGGDYGYGDNSRGFYDSYQQTGFSSRNILGHDDLKGLAGSQQQSQAASVLPPSSSQPSQQHAQSSQAASQPQPGGNNPQGYPPPVPFYYPYQNQYYGSPYNSGYVPQPFVKYPTMYQPGPPGPGSAPSPAAKQAPNPVQPQSYGQSLYGQQHPSSAYDDVGYQHHSQHQHHGSHGQSVGGGLPSSDYAKQLYGAQGMQAFMGLGQSSTPSSAAPIGQRGAGSPETSYKPYAPNVGVKDVGAGVGVGVSQTGVGQTPPGRMQQPQQGGFYGANRFASSSAAGPQSQQSQQPQNQIPQAHLGGYPQGASDAASFYSFQPRQQQAYGWH